MAEVVMGRVMVQGQLVIVRVVAFFLDGLASLEEREEEGSPY